MAEIMIVGWDHDKVVIPDLTTSVLARYNPNKPQPYLQEFVEQRKLFTYEDVKKWWNEFGKHKYGRESASGAGPLDHPESLTTVGDVADMLTDFLYKMQKPDGTPIITKEQTIEAKNYLLRGLTAKQVQEIIEKVPLTKGFEYTFDVFKRAEITQTLFSDGLGIAVEHQGDRLGFSDYGGVPAKLNAVIKPVHDFFADLLSEDGVTIFMKDMESLELTGEVGKYDKWEEFFESIKMDTDALCDVAVIDDSAANIKPMKRIQNAGGIAIAFNPTDAHFKQFKEAEIPVLKQTEPNLEPFAEIVLAPESERADVIRRYCV